MRYRDELISTDRSGEKVLSLPINSFFRSLASAWGEHRERAHTLALPAGHKRLITQANHWDLLNRPEAAQALRDWLA